MAYDIYFAFTPLHLKIVNSIPKKNQAILVVLNTRSLNAYKESYIDESSFMKIYEYQSKYFNPINLIKICKKYRCIENLYVGNFKFLNFRLIELFIDYKKLVTFDDGVGGITKTYFNTNSNTLKEFIYKILQIDIASIMGKHIKHYSIYDADEGIFDNKSEALILQKINKSFPYDGNVLLTTDKSESGTMSIVDEKLLMQKIIHNLNIKYLIHHPSKKYNRVFDNVAIIDEPYLSDDIASCSAFNHVYSLSASSILGIVKLKLLPENKITYLANKDAPVMKLLKSNTKINTIYFEDL